MVRKAVRKKRRMCLLAVAVCVACFAGCGSEKESPEREAIMSEPEKKEIVVTLTPEITVTPECNNSKSDSDAGAYSNADTESDTGTDSNTSA